MNFLSRSSVTILLVAILFSGCTSSPFYQKVVPIPQNAWRYDFKPNFKIEIADSTVGYQLYFIIRHTDAYPFANIWMWLYVKRPGDSTFERARVDVLMAEPSGKWMGRGMGELWEQRLPINYGGKPLFTKVGTYEFKLEQNMRVNPLPEVIDVGLRVAKNGVKTVDQQ